ncbi:PKD domain-containing protein [Poritiphilus flavus]|uniref:T9SS type B sorting domain-containing protein n=1 Tax=Poritiphilus flavus TaxID=2697053 RepID=A0A6L9E7P4_9FLAO|nr:PKD domain-containing protein [Poritiphilus flavus]NAS10756.1 T9SS type B sorting domain-containing protein [Poritiphilus flavus]
MKKLLFILGFCFCLSATAQIEVTNQCFGDVAFQFLSSESIWKIEWDFDDGNTLESENLAPVQHTYTETRIYTVSVRVLTSSGTRTETKTISIDILPEVNNWTVCSDNIDGSYNFNLAGKNDEILSGLPDNYVVSYHLNSQDANGNTGSQQNVNLFSNAPAKTIYARVQNQNNISCYNITTFDLIVNATPVAKEEVQNWTVCLNSDVKSYTFLLSNKNDEILDGQPSDKYIVSYHLNLQDAQGNANSEENVTVSIGDPEQTIHARIQNRNNANCYDTTSFNLSVHNNPVAKEDVENWTVCVDSDVDSYTFNLTDKNDEILDGQPADEYTVSYHLIPEDQGITSIDVSNSQEVYYRITNKDNTDCFVTDNFMLQVLKRPMDFKNIVVCHEGETDPYTFNLEDALPFGSSDNEYSVSYFETTQDALDNNNPINGTIYQTNETVKWLYARVTHDQSDSCYEVKKFQLFVNFSPKPNLQETYVICPDSPDLTLNGGDFDSWVWRKIENGEIISEYNSRNIEIKDIEDFGNYSLTVMQSQHEKVCVNTVYFEVVPSDVPETLSVSTSGSSDEITLTITATGTGNFEYSIDGNTYQPSNIFQISPGVHTVYVRDPSECRTLTEEVTVFPMEIEVNQCGNTTGFQVSSSETIQSILWDFGDGNTSTEDKPTHTYNAFGDYAVSAEVTTLNGTRTEKKDITTYAKPRAPAEEKVWLECDDDYDGFYTFILTDKNDEILDGQLPDKYTLSYHSSLDDAQKGQEAITDIGVSNSQEVFYRIANDNNTDCFVTGNMTLKVLNRPVNAKNIVVCDNGETGPYTFNLEDVLPYGSSDSEYSVSYFETSQDAFYNQNPINGTTYQTDQLQKKLYARVTHKQSDGCFDVKEFQLFVNSSPQPNLQETYFICPDGPGLSLDGGDFESLVWETESGGIISANRTVQIQDAGKYFLTAIHTENGIACENTVGFEVINSGAPETLSVSTSGSSDEIILTITATGTGDLEYSIDGNTYQPNNVFQISPGEYTVYVRDASECRTLTEEVTVYPLEIEVNQCGYTAEFQVSSGETIQNILWNFGDGNTSVEEKPTHTYNAFGDYTVSVEVTTLNGTRTEKMDITIDSPPLAPSHSIANVALCMVDNEIFRLSDKDDEILDGQSPTEYAISYHSSLDDAQNGRNAITEPYTNNNRFETIHARIYTVENPACYDVTDFELTIKKAPKLLVVGDLIACDSDGQYEFNLAIKNTEILGNQQEPAQFNISYHSSREDAVADADALALNYTNTDPTETLFFRIENSTYAECFEVGSFALQVIDEVTAGTANDISVCDISNDGIYTFDLTTQNDKILGDQQEASKFNITYHTSWEDADSGAEPLDNPKTFSNTAPYQQTIYARVENRENAHCYSTSSFQLFVNPLPQLNLEETYFICPDSQGLSLDGGDFDRWIWETENGEIIILNRSVVIQDPGKYFLTAMQTQNGISCEKTVGFEVIRTGAPETLSVSTSGFSDVITLTITATGTGELEYSVDGHNYQSNNVFKIFPGLYTVYVRDPLSCRILTEEVAAVGYQKFFTPNGDGIHEYWNIIGAEGIPDATTAIYDQYGKLMQRIPTTSKGWDGSYLGNPSPANDYWFKFEYQNGKVLSGHFTLKR